MVIKNVTHVVLRDDAPVVKHDIGIRKEDMGVVTKLLRSSIYSDPIGTIVREYTSNCLDAHAEAGIEDVPVEVSITASTRDILVEANYTISFQDYGIGISPDRIANIFCNYGASTKRESNDYIGGFGIGAKSMFAYTNTFFVRTVHNGVEYLYNCLLDENDDSTIELVYSTETTERSGTKVFASILSDNDVQAFKRAIGKQLLFVQNKVRFSFLDLNSEESSNELFGQIQVVKTTPLYHIIHVKQDVHAFSNLCAVGDIAYSFPHSDYFQSIVTQYNAQTHHIVPRFKIGELQVTASRENIYLDPNGKTIRFIEQRFTEIRETVLNDIKRIISTVDYATLLRFLLLDRNLIQLPELIFRFYQAEFESTLFGPNWNLYKQMYTTLNGISVNPIELVKVGNVYYIGPNNKRSTYTLLRNAKQQSIPLLDVSHRTVQSNSLVWIWLTVLPYVQKGIPITRKVLAACHSNPEKIRFAFLLLRVLENHFGTTLTVYTGTVKSVAKQLGIQSGSLPLDEVKVKQRSVIRDFNARVYRTNRLVSEITNYETFSSVFNAPNTMFYVVLAKQDTLFKASLRTCQRFLPEFSWGKPKVSVISMVVLYRQRDYKRIIGLFKQCPNVKFVEVDNSDHAESLEGKLLSLWKPLIYLAAWYQLLKVNSFIHRIGFLPEPNDLRVRNYTDGVNWRDYPYLLTKQGRNLYDRLSAIVKNLSSLEADSRNDMQLALFPFVKLQEEIQCTASMPAVSVIKENLYSDLTQLYNKAVQLLADQNQSVALILRHSKTLLHFTNQLLTYVEQTTPPLPATQRSTDVDSERTDLQP
jgi:hypothetical protein